jgi:hypothetical protein
MAAAGEPITPHEVTMKAIVDIPAEVIDAFNRLIVRHYNVTTRKAVISIVAAEDALREIGIDRGTAYAKRWFDVEPIFTRAGWHVTFHKTFPGDTQPYYEFLART